MTGGPAGGDPPPAPAASPAPGGPAEGAEPLVADLGERFLHPHGAHPGRGGRVGLLVGGLVIGAALALTVANLLPSDPSGRAIADGSAALHGLPAESPAPAPRTRVLLDAEAEGVPFPRYEPAFGWGATGMREDEVSGRPVVTTFYERGGHRIGYTVVAGPPVDAPRDAGRIVVAGTRVRTLRSNGRTVVMWRRLGHTLVMSGVGVPRRTLARLAGWRGGGGVPF